MALGIMAFIILQRLGELAWANRNTRRLISMGGKEFSPRHYKIIVLLHLSWIIAILVSLWQRPDVQIADVFFITFILLTVFRVWILTTLGPYFTTKIISIPGVPLRKTGPYPYFKHPNYLLVVFEIAVVPLMFGLWEIALIWSVLNLFILRYRVKQEDAALNERRILNESEKLLDTQL
jgi:methyltransferase